MQRCFNIQLATNQVINAYEILHAIIIFVWLQIIKIFSLNNSSNSRKPINVLYVYNNGMALDLFKSIEYFIELCKRCMMIK